LPTCLGYLGGDVSASTGRPACEQVIATTSAPGVAGCLQQALNGTPTSAAGKAACTEAALNSTDAFLQDCWLGIADLSHFGMSSCLHIYRKS
jgi:hypothetical protein